MQNSRSQQHIQFIDAVKGIGILLVVTGHALDSFLAWSGSNSRILTACLNWIYFFHMPLLFTASGFLAALSLKRREVYGTRENGRYVLRHVLNFLLLYIIYSVLYCLLKACFSGYVIESRGMRDILMLPIRPVGPYWYLYVLAIFYLLFAYFQLRLVSVKLLLIIALPLSASFFFIPHNLPFALDKVLHEAPFYVIGMCLASAYISRGRIYSALMRPHVGLFSAVLAVGSSYYIIAAAPAGGARAAAETLTAVFHVLAVFCLMNYICDCRAASALIRTLIYLGVHSLEIYLLHVYIVTGLTGRLASLIGSITIIPAVAAGVLLPLLVGQAANALHLYDIVFRPGTVLIKHK